MHKFHLEEDAPISYTSIGVLTVAMFLVNINCILAAGRSLYLLMHNKGAQT